MACSEELRDEFEADTAGGAHDEPALLAVADGGRELRCGGLGLVSARLKLVGVGGRWVQKVLEGGHGCVLERWCSTFACEQCGQ